MRKIYIILSICIITILFSTNVVLAFEDEEYNVRVRIRSPRQYNEQAELDGYDNISVYKNKNDNMELLFKTDNNLSILLDSFYDSKFNFFEGKGNGAVVGPYHVCLKDSFFTYEEVENEIEILNERTGIKFYPFYNGSEYEIYSGSYVDEKQANELVTVLEDNGLDSIIENGESQNVVIYNDNNDIEFMYSKNYNIFFTSYNSGEEVEMIKIDNRPYRGMIGFYIIENYKLISINYVDLESYLYGVVPNEISASWHIESIKAQSVAARTYAVSCITPNSSYGYDLDDNQNSQVYRGYFSENKLSNKAVDETMGEMIYYDGELIHAFYHSTSGGMTEDSENIWYEEVPYLRGVDDEFSNNSDSPHNEWEISYSKDDIIDMLREDGHAINRIYGIEITDISENNRVIECIFSTDIGEISYKKENARLLLGLKSSWFMIGSGNFFYFTNENYFSNFKSNSDEDGIIGSILEEDELSDSSEFLDSGALNGRAVISSNGNYELNKENVAFISSKGVTIESVNSSKYTFNGRGWGHGIGMSQYGAKEMAEEGFDYEKILKYYYTGVNIR
ncbi:SpoIID/LytB domain-containing protein [Sedimentibacter sp. MB31-C6]|uniref:SpoIID/LytB domain-containing protein n=1 Tax=Sedimentibacter sp. MB31-C6 TaxID=3109366 RepID=UPI002DDCED15|nr:SpoIID/LytB domain-containing protein [Sedimentibacter sp. MB36-C1]WSI04485.1 SpoIID/LytB domain-containing protein [Sedimentibacter sp. MB36-C1]